MTGSGQLSEETIRSCTYDKAFSRGERYYSQGRVTNVRVDGLQYQAAVIGTEPYRVELDLGNLTGNCDCYAFEGGLWCKHMVALGLSIARGERRTETEPQVKNRPGSGRGGAGWTNISDLRAKLTGQPAAVLVDVIQKLADRDPDAWAIVERIVNPPVMDSAADIVAAVKQALTPVKRAHSWHRQTEAAMQAREDIEYVAEQAAASEVGVKGLLQAATWLYRQLERIDDSDGELQEAAGALMSRAVKIVGEHVEWAGLLYEPLLEPTELPLLEMILSEGNETLRRDCVARLEKHRYKRDVRLVAVGQDRAETLLLHYFADHGDGRLIELLGEVRAPEHYRLGLLLRYYAVRGEWEALVDLAWPKRRDHQVRRPLRAALEQLHDTQKLIELQILETMEASDPLAALQRLEHVLRQHGQPERLSEVTERLLKGRDVVFEHKLALLLKLKRFEEAATLACRIIERPPVRHTYQYAQPYAYIDEIAAFAEQLGAVAPEYARAVWRALFSQELGRVVKSNQYARFERFGRSLLALNDRPWLQPFLTKLMDTYPTRKKLMVICRQLSVIDL